jgi:hypothetical protein
MGDFAVVIHLGTNRIYELNSTAAQVWEHLRSGVTVDATLAQLAQDYEAPPAIIRSEVHGIIGELLAESLIVAA